ncbi:MAG: hypothetical protein VX154_00185 [Pseudomonadota bacterium]|nr:hypothetical protein [Pseudomonadota bacterium]
MDKEEFLSPLGIVIKPYIPDAELYGGYSLCVRFSGHGADQMKEILQPMIEKASKLPRSKKTVEIDYPYTEISESCIDCVFRRTGFVEICGQRVSKPPSICGFKGIPISDQYIDVGEIVRVSFDVRVSRLEVMGNIGNVRCVLNKIQMANQESSIMPPLQEDSKELERLRTKIKVFNSA